MATTLVRHSIFKVIACAAFACLAFCASAKTLTVPTPSASKGSIKAYVKIKWKKVSGAKGYYIFRGTSSSFDAAKRIKTISKQKTVSYKDKKASATGTKYCYWVCPRGKKYYYFNRSRYAIGYRKATKKKNSGGSTSSSYYFADYNGKKLGASISLSVGSSKTLTLRSSSGSALFCNWLRSNGNVMGNSTSVSDKSTSYMIYAMSPGSTVISAIYGSKTYKITVTVSGGGSTGTYISGSSSIPYGTTKKYELYRNGKKQTNVTWKLGSYLSKVVVSAGTLSVKPTSRPVTTFKTSITAYVNGQKVGSKAITITR